MVKESIALAADNLIKIEDWSFGVLAHVTVPHGAAPWVVSNYRPDCPHDYSEDTTDEYAYLDREAGRGEDDPLWADATEARIAFVASFEDFKEYVAKLCPSSVCDTMGILGAPWHGGFGLSPAFALEVCDQDAISSVFVEPLIKDFDPVPACGGLLDVEPDQAAVEALYKAMWEKIKNAVEDMI